MLYIFLGGGGGGCVKVQYVNNARINIQMEFGECTFIDQIKYFYLFEIIILFSICLLLFLFN